MTEREEELTERLLTALARHLGQEPERSPRRAVPAQRSPVMLAAWAQATARTATSEQRRPRLAEK